MRHVEQRRVILVDEHHHLLASLPVNRGYQVGQPVVDTVAVICDAKFSLFVFQLITKIFCQLLSLHMLAKAHVKVQHGISVPFLFKLINGKALKEVFPALEIALEGGHQQRLAEPAWAAQEEILAIGMRHVIDISSLVDIEEILFENLLKCLDSYGI